MKTIITTIILASIIFFSGCKEENKTDTITASTTSEILKTETPAKKQTTINGLKQNGDYTSLFNRAPKDCSFITPEKLATSLQVSSNMIERSKDGCTYHLKEENGQKTRFYFVIESWGVDKVVKEIKTAKENAENFGKDSKLSQYRISKTGDTYLSMHQNRMVRILNETSDTVIVILYTPTIDPAEEDINKTIKLKDEAKERAYTISNFLLKTYQ